jgi:hypothetical protein
MFLFGDMRTSLADFGRMKARKGIDYRFNIREDGENLM